MGVVRGAMTTFWLLVPSCASTDVSHRHPHTSVPVDLPAQTKSNLPIYVSESSPRPTATKYNGKQALRPFHPFLHPVVREPGYDGEISKGHLKP